MIKILESGKSNLSERLNKAVNLHLLSDSEIVQLQHSLIEILEDISSMCIKNDLHPILVGGSLLGKVRHDGFIPWDDDLDIGFFRCEYNKFRNVFLKSDLNNRYILRGPGCIDGASSRFLKIFKKNSVLEDVIDLPDVPKKIYIDIFPIDYIPDKVLYQRFRGVSANILMGITSCMETAEARGQVLSENLSVKQRFRRKFSFMVAKIFSFRTRSSWYNYLDRLVDEEKKGKYVTIAVGRKHYFGEIIPETTMFPLKETEFCGVKVWIPHRPDIYLENLYGDYMKIPPEEKREHHYFKKMVLNTDE